MVNNRRYVKVDHNLPNRLFDVRLVTWLLSTSKAILQFRVLVCSVLASKPSNIFFCFIDSLRKRMEFVKKDNRIDLKSHAFILTIRNILHTNEANTEHWRIRNWIVIYV